MTKSAIFVLRNSRSMYRKPAIVLISGSWPIGSKVFVDMLTRGVKYDAIGKISAVADCLEDQFRPNETDDQFRDHYKLIRRGVQRFATLNSILVLSQCQATK